MRLIVEIKLDQGIPIPSTISVLIILTEDTLAQCKWIVIDFFYK